MNLHLHYHYYLLTLSFLQNICIYKLYWRIYYHNISIGEPNINIVKDCVDYKDSYMMY